jgi:hypothetical protein
MSSDDFIDPKAREWMITSCTKDRAGGGSLTFGEQLLKMFNSLVPERAESPLVSLAVQTYFAGCLEIEVFDSNIAHVG